MLKNYILITIRNFRKHATFTLINVFGLTLGLTVCLLIYLFVKDQISYDSFHTNKDHIYRLLRIGTLNDESYRIGVTSFPFADALVNDFPDEIKSATRVMKASTLVTANDEKFIEDDVFLADSNFFQTFSYPLLRGDRNTALALPNNIVITESIAIKYFGDEDPIGKSILVDSELDYVVTGILGTAPTKSHLKFDFVANIAPLKQYGFMQDWWSNGLLTYVTLHDGVQQDDLEQHFAAFMDKYFGEDFIQMQNKIGLTLQPLKEVYFGNDVKYDSISHGNKNFIYIFSLVGVFIFVIACINFMNLATAKSVQRAKEVGVRKTLGSTKNMLKLQFFVESISLATISVMLAFMVVELVLPLFNDWFQTDLQPIREVSMILLLAVGVILLTGLFAGFYPAIILSSFKPHEVLKGTIGRSGGSHWLRKSLVVLQFSISIFLIIFTLVISKQMSLIKNTDLGFDQDQVVLLQLNYNEINNHIDTFKERIDAMPEVKSATLSSGVPGGFHDTMAMKIEGEEDQPRVKTLFTDADYLHTFGLTLVAGRFLSDEYATDKTEAIVINETTAKLLNWSNEEAVGKRMHNSFIDSTYRSVVGVVKDYHFSSLKSEIEPIAIQWARRSSLMSIKLQSGANTQEVLKNIQAQWNEYVPYDPNFRFLDDTINDLYINEILQARLFSLFSSISIIIACLGIFGLASYTAQQRKKEIGIRKSLGASVANISKLLASDYIKLVIIANVIAWPLSYYFADLWLQEFATRTSVGISVLVTALFAGLAIATLSVLFQSLRAAAANPVETLKED